MTPNSALKTCVLRQRTALDGKSPGIAKLQEDMARAADTDWPVLILGERGTGKELVAWELHTKSRRSEKRITFCR